MRTVTAVMAGLGLVVWLLWLIFYAGALRHQRAEAQLRIANVTEEREIG